MTLRRGGGTYAPLFWGREATLQMRTSIEDAVGTPPGTPEAHGRKHSVDFLKLVRLAPLMELSCGSPEIGIGLMDGPVAVTHPDLAAETIRGITGQRDYWPAERWMHPLSGSWPNSSKNIQKIVKLTTLLGPPAKSQLRGLLYSVYEREAQTGELKPIGGCL
jgi:hypothetical protein